MLPLPYLPPPTPSLSHLPPELHPLITSHLTYPDLLSLKLTHPNFYHTIHPTTYDRVLWLLYRTRHRLPIPISSRCLLNSDGEFCSNPEVVLILRRRWQHLECTDYASWCREVPGGGRCKGSRKWLDRRPRYGTLHWCTCGLSTRIYRNFPSWEAVWHAIFGAVVAVVVSQFC